MKLHKSSDAKLALEMVRTLQTELKGARRLAKSALVVASGAIIFAGTLASICLSHI